MYIVQKIDIQRVGIVKVYTGEPITMVHRDSLAGVGEKEEEGKGGKEKGGGEKWEDGGEKWGQCGGVPLSPISRTCYCSQSHINTYTHEHNNDIVNIYIFISVCLQD